MLELHDYLYGVALGGAVFLLMLTPILYAGAVAFWPGRRPAKKLWYSIICGLLAYGSAILTFILFSPFEMVAIYFAPSWQDQGWEVLPSIFSSISESIEVVSLVVGIIVGLVAPIHLRRNIWPKIHPNAA